MLTAVVPWKAHWPLPSLGVGSVLLLSFAHLGIDLESSRVRMGGSGGSGKLGSQLIPPWEVESGDV